MAPCPSYPLPANVSPYGAFDMAGNVGEWVFDWWKSRSDYYANSPYRNPIGPPEGTGRVNRGGSLFDWPDDLAVWRRTAIAPAAGAIYRGFRCAKSTDDTPTSVPSSSWGEIKNQAREDD